MVTKRCGTYGIRTTYLSINGFMISIRKKDLKIILEILATRDLCLKEDCALGLI